MIRFEWNATVNHYLYHTTDLPGTKLEDYKISIKLKHSLY
jgi:hypothetical protein